MARKRANRRGHDTCMPALTTRTIQLRLTSKELSLLTQLVSRENPELEHQIYAAWDKAIHTEETGEEVESS